jgi:hypothetical protein
MMLHIHLSTFGQNQQYTVRLLFTVITVKAVPAVLYMHTITVNAVPAVLYMHTITVNAAPAVLHMHTIKELL